MMKTVNMKLALAGVAGAVLVLAQAVLLSSCEPEATPSLPLIDLAEYQLSATAEAPLFSYDSLTYGPSINGTSKRRATGTWHLELESSSDTSMQGSPTHVDRYRATVRDSSGRTISSFAWIWRLLPDGAGLTHQADGIEYLALARPATTGVMWDPLVYTDAELEVTIRAEPIAIHKNWAARVDSLGSYTTPSGKTVEAVFVTHVETENRIELRQVREVYGRGVGLLLRDMQILDSQNLQDLPWDQKAEKGFTLTLKRLI